ncbi:MAG: hypothetical protein ACLT0O_11350 [Sutterella wadsworthensis]
MRRYLKQVLIAFDQLINALLGGWADEPLCARMATALEAEIGVLLIDAILFFDGNHCLTSW